MRRTTSEFSGSPAATASRSDIGNRLRSSRIRLRQTVGGAQKEVTSQRDIISSSGRAANLGWLTIMTVASAFQGENRLLQAHFPHPGEEMLRCTSPGRRPSQYMVDRWPTG